MCRMLHHLRRLLFVQRISQPGTARRQPQCMAAHLRRHKLYPKTSEDLNLLMLLPCTVSALVSADLAQDSSRDLPVLQLRLRPAQATRHSEVGRRKHGAAHTPTQVALRRRI